MEKPLVTIVTITFNLVKAGREKTFRQCLESVHDQTYKNIEHMIIDGASKDGTVDLIKEYVQKGWIKYISEPDNGIYDAMNKGIKMANGEYVAFLNSDDYYHKNNGIEASIEALKKSGADFSYAPVIIINEDGSEFGANHYQSRPKISNVFFVMPFCHQTMFTKKSVMFAEGMFDTNFKNASDYDFLLRLCLKRYESVFVDFAFVTYRLGGLSDSNQEQSINEVTKSYFNNFGKLLPLTMEECKKIYGYESVGMPLKLAKKLREFEPHFDYDEYLKKNSLKNKCLVIFKNKLAEWYFKLSSIFLSKK